ncbi:LysM peptidoglycan-binding domain-containing protein [Candidatus Saccharibacteria bacterium]|nr:LysM peptidoglycan-binding domain-containing protein [Candidatus Saccharibacteria bacterium]
MQTTYRPETAQIPITEALDADELRGIDLSQFRRLSLNEHKIQKILDETDRSLKTTDTDLWVSYGENSLRPDEKVTDYPLAVVLTLAEFVAELPDKPFDNITFLKKNSQDPLFRELHDQLAKDQSLKLALNVALEDIFGVAKQDRIFQKHRDRISLALMELSLIRESETQQSTRISSKKRNFRLGRSLGVGIVGVLAIAGTSEVALKNDENKSSVAESTTTIDHSNITENIIISQPAPSTSAEQQPEFICPKPAEDGSIATIVQYGDSMWKIAEACNTSVSALKELNEYIEDVNDIKTGQIVLIKPTTASTATTENPIIITNYAPASTVPETTTTPVPETTLAAIEEPLPEITVVPELVQETTIPAVEETAPPQPQSDGTLSAQACKDKGGTHQQAFNGIGGWEFLRKFYAAQGYTVTNNELGSYYNTTQPDDFRIRDITGSTPEHKVFECAPSFSDFMKYAR